MTSTFDTRIELLKALVGEPGMTAHVVVDQVCAKYQHERLDLHHPRGGEAEYLRRPLYDHFGSYLKAYASQVLHDGGKRAMVNAAEHLSDQVEAHAPREFGDLMFSGHPSVTRGGAVVFDRPPKVGRLSEAELRAKGRIRTGMLIAAGLPWFFTRHGKVIRVPGRHG